MDTNRKQVDSGRNQDKLSIESSKQPDSESFKDDSAPRLLTLNKISEPNYRAPLLLPTDIGESLSLTTDLGESPSLPIESSNTLVKKKPYYIMVPVEEAKLKKKINGNIGEQNVVIGKRIKK